MPGTVRQAKLNISHRPNGQWRLNIYTRVLPREMKWKWLPYDFVNWEDAVAKAQESAEHLREFDWEVEVEL